jgi:predicted phosphodiesterase
MTRIAVLADIHGNADALEPVLYAAREAGATQLVVLGDLVGYYYEPARVLDLLAGWTSIIIRGNHEDLLGMWLGGDPTTRAALRTHHGSGFAACEALLSKSTLRWLQALPHPLLISVDGRRALLSHGHPAAIDTYVYPDGVETALSEKEVMVADIVWLAHTHHPMDVTRAGVRICNPGSVGQSRDRDPRASWAIWEPAIGNVTWHRTQYDRSALLREIAKRDPDVPYLREVLTRTKDSRDQE